MEEMPNNDYYSAGRRRLICLGCCKQQLCVEQAEVLLGRGGTREYLWTGACPWVYVEVLVATA
jgi:hypothetical protein